MRKRILETKLFAFRTGFSCFLILLFSVTLHAQYNVVISSINANNGSGSVLNTGAITNGHPITVGANRCQWAVFDLNVIPAGATITNVTLQVTLNSAIAVSGKHAFGVPGNQSAITGTTLFSYGTLAGSQGAGGGQLTSSTMSFSGNNNDVVSATLNATAVSLVQNNMTGNLTVVIGVGSTIIGGSIKGGTDAGRPRLSITYTLPPCLTPADQPQAPMLFSNVTTGSMDGSFTAAASNPTNYLVVRYPSGATAANPVDGVTYSTGNTLGSGTVVAAINTTSFTAASLTGGAAYDFYVYAYNANGCAPAYNTVSPLTATQSTLSCLPVNPSGGISFLPLLTQIDGSFTAASPSPTAGYLIVRYPAGSVVTSPVNGTSYTAGNALGGGTIVSAGSSSGFSATGLSPHTSYDFYVYSFNNGSGCSYVYNTATPLAGNSATTPCSGPGNVTKTIPGDYNTITDALADLQLTGISGPVVLELQNNYVTEAPAGTITIGNNVCFTEVNTLTIRPAASANGLIITSSVSGPTLDLNGAKHVKIDGRPGGISGNPILVTAAGNTNATNLNIINTATGGTAVRMDNGATGNAVKYCDLQGRNTTGANVPAGMAGVVYIGNNGANGNDNNIVDHCNIHSTGTGSNVPSIGVYVLGATNNGLAANFNDNGTISNNNLYDYFLAGGNSAGIELNHGVNGWTITGNHLFQTSARTFTAAGYNRGIWIVPNRNSGSAGNGFTVSNNYIGGSEPMCGGSVYSLSSQANFFTGIRLEIADGTSPDASTVQGNVIKNLSISSTVTTANDVFQGIAVTASEGDVNVGTVTGNMIGSNGTDGISIAAGSGSHAIGLFISNSSAGATTTNISNNTIAGITLTNAGNSFSGIFDNQSGTVNIDNNLIGSTTTANSIASANTGTTTRFMRGINISSGTGTVNITNNTIANLSNSTTSTTSGAQTAGIYIGGTTPNIPMINGNTIFNLSCAAAQTGTAGNTAVAGILMTSNSTTACHIAANKIHSLESTAASATATISVEGIYVAGAASSVRNISKNFVHSLNLTANNPNAVLRGIELGSGTGNVENNMVRLGIRPDGSYLTTALSMQGILKASGAGNLNIYHNSVYIGGENVGTNTNATHAFRRSSTNGNDDIRNNIFVNNRSNATTGGNHYAIAFTTASTGASPDYNIYQTTGTNGVFANNGSGSGDITVYTPGWISSDANSITADPKFLNPLGTAANVDLHIDANTVPPGEQTGVLIAGITEDYDGDDRTLMSPVDRGADALNLIPCAIPVAGTASGPASVCGSNAIQLSLTGYTTNSGISIQWQNAPQGSNAWSNIPGATNADVTIASTSASTDFRALVICSFSSLWDSSNIVTVSYHPTPVGGTASGPANAETYVPANYTLSGNGGNLQWEMATNIAGPYTAVSGANAASFSYTFFTGGIFYVRCHASGAGCPDDYSNSITTTVSVAGDNICQPQIINLGNNGPYTNNGATDEPGESVPPATGCFTQTGWCSIGVLHTVWFSFTPAVTGKYDFGSDAGFNTAFDNQFALYSASACSPFTGLTLLAANDDSAAGFTNAYIEPFCLNAGTTYYLQVNGKSNITADNWGVRINSYYATYFADADGDGYGNSNLPQITACPGITPAGYASTGGDCDDTDPLITTVCCVACGGLVKSLKAPGSITASPKMDYCAGDTAGFSITATASPAVVCYYKWTVPAGADIISGQGSTGITVVFNTGYTTGGAVTVVQKNGCGISPAKTLNIKKGLNKDKLAFNALLNKDGLCPGETRTYSVTVTPAVPARPTVGYTWSTDAVNYSLQIGQGTQTATFSAASGFVAGNVYVSSENACGLSTQKKTGVKVGKVPKAVMNVTPLLPATPTTTAPVGYCGYTGAAFSANGTPVPGAGVPSFQYLWSLDATVNGTIAGTQPQASSTGTVDFGTGWATGSVQVQVVNGCGASSIKKVKVQSKPTDITAAHLSGPSSLLINNGDTGTFTVSIPAFGATAYVWTGPKGATLINGTKVTYAGAGGTPKDTTAGSINLSLGAKGGVLKFYPVNNCAISKGGTLTIAGTPNRLGYNIKEQLTGTIQLYPNPAHEILNIAFTASEEGRYRLLVYDALGKLVKEKEGRAEIGTNRGSFSVEGLAAGMYQLFIETGGTHYKARFVVE